MLIAAFDSTVVAATAITASATVAGGIFGYLTGRESKKVARVQAEAELKRLREQREELDREARRQLYREFLDAERGLDTFLSDAKPITSDRFYDWVDEYTARYNALLLLGTGEVSSRVAQFGPIRRELFYGLQDASHDFDQAVRTACEQSEDVRREGRHAIIDAMRIDVAADHAPIYVNRQTTETLDR